MNTLMVQKRKRMRREVCRGRKRTSRRRRVTHPSIVSHHTAPPHQPCNTPRGSLSRCGMILLSEVIHKVNLGKDFSNDTKVAAAAAPGERKATVSYWLSLILQLCLCHHGREILGLGPLVHTYSSERSLTGPVSGAER